MTNEHHRRKSPNTAPGPARAQKGELQTSLSSFFIMPDGASQALIILISAWILTTCTSVTHHHNLRDTRNLTEIQRRLGQPQQKPAQRQQQEGLIGADGKVVMSLSPSSMMTWRTTTTQDPLHSFLEGQERGEEAEELGGEGSEERWCERHVREAVRKGGSSRPDRRAVKWATEEEQRSASSLFKEMVSTVWRMYGKLKEAEVVKELYLHFAGRSHPFPFCAWQVEFDPRMLTPVLLDTNSVYRLQALHFTTTTDVFRIRGRFPRVRYFSFQSYDSRGQPLSTLPDFLVRPHDGHNPFTTPLPPGCDDNSTFEVYITANGRHGYPNELAGLHDAVGPYLHHHHVLDVKTTTIIYRLYGADPITATATRSSRSSTGKSGDGWGFVEPPVVEKRVLGAARGDGEWEVMPLCSQDETDNLARRFVQMDQRYMEPLPSKESVCGLYDKAGKGLQVVNATYPFGHLESPDIHAYVVYTNKDSNYLYWCDSMRRLLGVDAASANHAPPSTPSFVLVLTGRLPVTPTGLYNGSRLIADPHSYEARYVSISSVENMAPSNTYHSISDAELHQHYHHHHEQQSWNRWYRVVASTERETAEACGLLDPSDVFLPFVKEGLGEPRLPGLVYREILSRYRVTGEPDASAAYLQSLCDGDNSDCSGDEPWRLEALSRAVMKEAYPVIQVYRCDVATGKKVQLA